jgi:hypothetical protein
VRFVAYPAQAHRIPRRQSSSQIPAASVILDVDRECTARARPEIAGKTSEGTVRLRQAYSFTVLSQSRVGSFCFCPLVPILVGQRSWRRGVSVRHFLELCQKPTRYPSDTPKLFGQSENVYSAQKASPPEVSTHAALRDFAACESCALNLQKMSPLLRKVTGRSFPGSNSLVESLHNLQLLYLRKCDHSLRIISLHFSRFDGPVRVRALDNTETIDPEELAFKLPCHDNSISECGW